ncbi:hypothetical protein PV328_000725 [Microctonus aethiopoides]|uniref:Uncharacterized protein n=1 Tax=Microctonus aethiopoides TaxID=144406 RepID=A0AA39KWX4_9HYME|nr:hypothetical protein PV328_000725 [Microctonus aethiopoides]
MEHQDQSLARRDVVIEVSDRRLSAPLFLSMAEKEEHCTTVRPIVSEISSFECKRILFHSISDIDATTGHTANQRAVLKSGENFLQDSIDRLDGFSGPIDQNLQKIKGTRFSYLTLTYNLFKNEKKIQTTPYLLQVDIDCKGWF